MPHALFEVPGRSPNPFYHPVSVARGQVIHVAGQVGEDADGVLAGTDLASQAAQAVRNIESALAVAGAELRDLVAVTVYVVNWSQEMADELAEGVLGRGDWPRPPATLIGVASLFVPEHLIEIQAVAVLPDRDGSG